MESVLKNNDQKQTKPPSKKRIRFRGKLIGLTFSNCETSKEACEQAFKRLYGDKLRRYAISRERHSGKHGDVTSHHLHCFLEFRSSETLSMKQLKKEVGVAPDFQALKMPASWLGYIAKDDSPLANFDFFKEAWSYSGKKDRLFKVLWEQGITPESIVVRHLDSLWSEDFQKYVRKARFVEDLREVERLAALPWLKKIDRKLIEDSLSKQELEEFDSFEGYQRLVNHLNQIGEYRFQQPHAPRQNVLVRGNTAIGKSTLMRLVARYVPTYEFPVDHWHPDYRDKFYGLILWDEPKLLPSKKETYLKILDGLTCDLPVKGSRAVRKDHQKIIMMSNLSLESLANQQKITDSMQKEAFKRRLDEIDFGDRNLDFLQKLIIPN